MKQREGEWEESVIDLGKPKGEITNLQIGVRIMHCRKRGGEAKFIGLCRAPLGSLQQQPENGYPILNGFQVMGWLRVLSLTIE
jgi:hypothetical protein